MDDQQRRLFAQELRELPFLLKLKLQDCYGLDGSFECGGYSCFLLDVEQAAVGFPGVVSLTGTVDTKLSLEVWLCKPDARERPVELVRIETGVEDVSRLSDHGQNLRSYARIELPSCGLALESCALRFISEFMKVAAEMVHDLTVRMTGDSP